jgi:hypothetical protein
VDKNPLAVDLARVSLWLATAAADHPLTFLDHRLRVGDSLLGLSLYLGEGDEPEVHLLKPDSPRDRSRRGQDRRVKRKDAELFAGVPMMDIITGTTRRLREHLNRALAHLKTVSQLMDDAPGDFGGQRMAFEAMQGELRPFWSLHQLRIGRMFLPPPESPAEADLVNRWLLEISQFGRPSEETHHISEPARARGEELGAFCWQLAFPEVFLGPSGLPLANAGFDAVIGNPPWDKIKPNERECFAQFDPTVWDLQGQERRNLIARLRRENSDAEAAWVKHETEMNALSSVLLDTGIYHHQVAEVEGKKTGGDPDTFKFFTERAYQLLHSAGRAGIIVPDTLQTALGSTGLRRLLLDTCDLQILVKLDNSLAIFPTVHFDKKFFALVFRKGGSTKSIEAAFFARRKADVLLHFRVQPHYLRVEANLYRELSPEQYTFVELHHQGEIDFLRRIYHQFPRLGERLEDVWNVSFIREFDMTNDSHLFRDAARLKELGATLHGRGPSPTEAAEGAPFEQVEGGEFWTTPEAVWYDAQSERFARVERLVDSRGRLHLAGEIPESRVKYQLRGYVLAHERDDRSALPVRPGETYVPLYEGRMIHQFDHCQKAYITGSGRRAKWKELSWHEKEIVPHYFMAKQEFLASYPDRLHDRFGYCRITGQTNERTLLASAIGGEGAVGEAVPTTNFMPNDYRTGLFWLCCMNSFIVDYLIRLQVSNNINFYMIEHLPVPRLDVDHQEVVNLTPFAARLSCMTKVLPNVKTTSRSIEGGRRCHSFAMPVDCCRRSIVQRLMQALVVVKRKIATQAGD